MNIFVEKCLPYLRKPYVDVSWLHSHPYYWADDGGPMRIVTFRTRAHWWVNISLVIAYFVFVVFRAGEAYRDPSKPLSDKFYMAVASIVYSLPVTYAVTAATTTNEFPPFLRSYLKFLQEGKIL